MNYGELMLSKVIENNATDVFKTYGIKEHHFQTQVERDAYRFIVEHVRTTRQCPDERLLVASLSGDFTYMPKVADSFEFLAESLKKWSAKVQMAEVIENEISDKFSELDADALLEWQIKRLETIREDTQIRKTVGREMSDLARDFREEYEKRKAGISSKMWETPFPKLTEKVSGWGAGEIYGIMAESGRGKSYLSIAIIHSLLSQGATVLVKSYELKSYLWLSRLFSIITASEGSFEHAQHKIRVGFENRQLLNAKLEEPKEEFLFEMLEQIASYYPGRLILQCKGDKNLTRTLDELERELQQNPEINAVFLDPFYGLSDVTSGRNANRTAGGAAEEAASRFEILCGEHDVIGFYAVQATVEKSKTDEENQRELKLPKRDQMKTSKRLLDICSLLIAFDSKPGIAKLGVEKGRNGGEGFEIELLALMDVGVLTEMPSGSVVAAQIDTTIY